MNLKKKKKGFTLIELMAVIAIIAILAAVLVPTVSGYINRSKKTAIITQIRTVVNAVETYDATATSQVGDISDLTIGDLVGGEKDDDALVNFKAQELITSDDISKLNTEVTYAEALEMNKEADLSNALTVDDGVIKYGETVVSN